MKRVTLTFDNGPSATTNQVLRELEQRGVLAYFCVVGSQLKKANEFVDCARETLGQGHRIVNHSLTHGVALGDDVSVEHARREVADMHDLMRDCLGDWGEPWFRPFGRGGEIGQHLLSAPALRELQAFNYSVLLWNCVPRDWEDTEGWVATALNQVDALEHSVIVVHDLATGAMDHLPRFIDALQALQVEFTLELPASCVPIRNGAAAFPALQMKQLVCEG